MLFALSVSIRPIRGNPRSIIKYQKSYQIIFFPLIQCANLLLLAQLTAHSSQLTAHSSQFTVHSLQLTVYSSQFTAHSLQFTVYSSQLTAHSSQLTAHSLQLTVSPFLNRSLAVGAIIFILLLNFYL